MRDFNIRSLAQLSLIIACMSYATAAVWARANIKDIHSIIAATGMLSSASIIMVPLALFVDGAPNYSLSVTTLGAMAFLSFPATAIAYLFILPRTTSSWEREPVTSHIISTPNGCYLGCTSFGRKAALYSLHWVCFNCVRNDHY